MLKVQTESLRETVTQMRTQARMLREQAANLETIQRRLRRCGGDAFDRQMPAISRQRMEVEQQAELAEQMAKVLEAAAEAYEGTERRSAGGGTGSARGTGEGFGVPAFPPGPIRGILPGFPGSWASIRWFSNHRVRLLPAGPNGLTGRFRMKRFPGLLHTVPPARLPAERIDSGFRTLIAPLMSSRSEEL